MKTKRILFAVIVLCLSLSLISCGKDGLTGPKGDTGSQGLVGPAGPKGAGGTAGSKIYSGNIVPALTTGAVGDFYVNTTTGFLYGPKTTNGWGIGYSLKGPAGATGAKGTAGSKTLSGTGAPGASLGSNGDFYLDRSSYLLYGPKMSAGWGVGINLRGPVGSANVIYSDWVEATPWIKTTIFDLTHFDYNIAATKITQDVLDKGTVIVYGKLNGYIPTIWKPGTVAVLPILVNYALGAASPTNTDTWSSIISLGNIEIDLVNSTNAYGVLGSPHSFRYVIIPGSIHVTGTKPVNFKDYEEVKRVYHVVD